LNLFSTIISHKIINIIPRIMPHKTLKVLEISSASGISSKQTIAVINPEASDKIKLKNLFEHLLKVTPIIPPKVVPKVPKNNPSIVVLNKLSILKNPFKTNFI